MLIIKFVVAIMLFWILRELIVGLFVWRSRRKIRQAIRRERTQSQFAQARNEVMRLAQTSRINMNSATFRFLYKINTFVMRRPDEYREISSWLTSMFLNPSKPAQNNALSEESKNWTPEIKSVVRLTAEAMDYIVLEYSWFLRCLYKLKRRTDPTLTPRKWLMGIARRMEDAQEKRDPIVSEIRKTQKKMQNLCTA